MKNKPIKYKRKNYIEQLWKFLSGTLNNLPESIDTDPSTTAEEFINFIYFYFERNKNFYINRLGNIFL